MSIRRSSFRPVIAFLAVVFSCLFLSFSARAAEPAAPPAPATQSDPAQPKPGAEVEKPAARREDVEPSTLTEAKTFLKTARDDRDKAEGELGAEQASHGKTKELLKNTLELCKTAQSERDTANASLKTMTGERDSEQKAHGKTKELLTLAEAAAGVLGVDPAKAVGVTSAANGGSILDRWTAAKGDERAKLFREHKDELYAEAKQRGIKIG